MVGSPVITTISSAFVSWDGGFSTIFSLSNGVRQGAVLGVILYWFYVNDLFKILRRNGSSCWMNSNYFGIIGYSDDSFLLAPSIDSLQEMLQVCEEYAFVHNLKFSTDPNPAKCKTKCLAFVARDRPLKHVQLCGNPLPWVSQGKHLGNTVENKMNGMKKDILNKRANYIAKNNELMQEFHFAHPKTKVVINQIYNGHFTGSPLWNLFCRETDMLCNSWNKSVRIMLGLPYNTHRYFLEPLTDLQHLKFTLISRFIGFLSQIEKSHKILPKILLQTIRKDCRSVTGSNIRNIVLMSGKDDINQLSQSDIKNMIYMPVAEHDRWKLNIVKELIDVKWGELSVEGFEDEDIDVIIEELCTS